MNIDPGMAAGYVMVAVGGFALGALAGRWMMAEVTSALSGVQLRLSALEQKVLGHSATTSSSTAASHGNSAAAVQSVVPAAPTAHRAPAAPQPPLPPPPPP